MALSLLAPGAAGLETNDIVTDEGKVSATDGGFGGTLVDDDRFGNATVGIGDLDGDGVEDLAVGTPRDDTGGTDRGAVWILIMNADGTVADERKIADSTGGLGTLSDGDVFGAGLARIGDLDSDGVVDLAVGAPGDDDAGTDAGAVRFLFLNADGTVASQTKLSDSSLNSGDRAGTSLSLVGEVDGDSTTTEFAAGLPGRNSNAGVVAIFGVDSGGTLVSGYFLSPSQSPDAGDRFGASVSGIGDADGDGIDDVAVGVRGDDDGGTDRGAVRLFTLNNGETKSELGKISDTSGGFGGTLADGDAFGSGLASVDDMDADGVRELAVGAAGTDDGGPDRGAVWMVFMNGDGTVQEEQKISDTDGGFDGTLADGDRFGDAVGNLTDLDGDGEPDIAAGAPRTDDGGTDRGSAWTMLLHDVDNVAPTANDDEATTDEDDNVWIDVLTDDTDSDGDTLSVESATDPAHGTVTIASNDTIEYEPDPDHDGDDTFDYTTSDGDRGTDTATVNVTVNAVNDAPVAEDDPTATDEDASVWIDVLANDTDVDGDTLSIASTTTPSHGSLNDPGNGSLEYVPDADYNGDDSFTYDVTDGSLTDQATVSITVNPVNDGPVADDDPATTDEDTTVTIDVLANDTDIDDDTLTIASTTSPTHGSTTVNADETITYEPVDDFNGEDSFTYEASDGSLTDQATVSITVNAVDDAPVAADDPTATDEDTSVWIDVLANDTDVDGDTLSIATTTTPSHGSLNDPGNGSLEYTPDPDYNGDDTFTYEASDGSLSDTATVNLTVNAVNDAPVAEDDATTTDEDASVWIDVLANDTDVDGDTLTIASANDPDNGITHLPGNGTVEYTPHPDYNGDDTFTYTTTDGQLTDTATVSITVNPVNDAPAANFSFSPSAPTSAETVSFNDNSSDPDGSVVAWNWTFGDGENSTARNPNHSFVESGTYTVRLTVEDDGGTSATTGANVTVEATSTAGGGGSSYDRSRVRDASIEHSIGSDSSTVEELSGWLPIPRTADRGEISVKSQRIPLERLRFEVSGEGMLSARVSVHEPTAESLHAPIPEGFRLSGPWVQVDLEPRAGSLAVGTTELRWRTTSEILGDDVDPRQATLLHGSESSWRPLSSRTVEVADGQVLVEATSPHLSPVALSADTSPPEITSVGPEGPVGFPTPILSATFDDNRGIDPDSVRVQLDGETLEGVGDREGFTYRPDENLTSGFHEVDVSIEDAGGLEAHRAWTFQVYEPERVEEDPAPNVLGPEGPDRGDRSEDERAQDRDRSPAPFPDPMIVVALVAPVAAALLGWRRRSRPG